MKSSTLITIANIIILLASIAAIVVGIIILLQSRRYDDVAYALIGSGAAGVFFSIILNGFNTIVKSAEKQL